MTDDTLYYKVGRRYKPWGRPYAGDAHPDGFYLLQVTPGCRATTPVEPAFVQVEAALRVAEDAMLRAMAEMPHPRSNRDVVQAGLDAVRKEMGQ